MKAVILAGGLGTRLAEETSVRPKPMVEIGGRPILWHIMKIFATHGVEEFVICCGYKGHFIKEYFANYALEHSDVTFDLAKNSMELHHNRSEPWRVTLVDTGALTGTGGRLKRVADYLDDTFLLSYGDDIASVDITSLIAFHRAEGRLATLSAVQPPGLFGALGLPDGSNRVEAFNEKRETEGSWVNGGFFVCEPAVIDEIEGDETMWEQGPLRSLAAKGQLSAFRHRGFWTTLESLNDKRRLEEMWSTGAAPWKVW